LTAPDAEPRDDDVRRADANANAAGAATSAGTKPVADVAAVPEEPPSYLGLAGRSSPILGGEAAIAGFHADSSAEARKLRLIEIRAALVQYVDGDPRDTLEYEQYEALEDEAVWLERNPGN